MDKPTTICNHGIRHRKTDQNYQCLFCKDECGVNIGLPVLNQEGEMIT